MMPDEWDITGWECLHCGHLSKNHSTPCPKGCDGEDFPPDSRLGRGLYTVVLGDGDVIATDEVEA